MVQHGKAAPQLQQRLAENVAWLARDFNDFCEREDFPLRIVHFSSVFRFIGGVAVGAASVIAPTYIAEIAPARIRGPMSP